MSWMEMQALKHLRMFIRWTAEGNSPASSEPGCRPPPFAHAYMATPGKPSVPSVLYIYSSLKAELVKKPIPLVIRNPASVQSTHCVGSKKKKKKLREPGDQSHLQETDTRRGGWRRPGKYGSASSYRFNINLST